MADYMNIFVEADLSLQDLVTVVESILDIKRQKYLDEYEPMYELYELHTVVLISENTFFNDEGVNVEDYHYQIDVRSLHNFTSAEEAQGWEKQRTHYLYDQLKATGQYRLMLTEEVYTKIAEFVPAVYSTTPSELASKAQTLPTELVIYVAGERSFPELVTELEQLLGVPALQRSASRNYVWYELREAKAWFILAQNRALERFPAYAYVIEVKGHVYISGERRYWQYVSATSLFAQLKATDRYRLVLVGDQDQVIDEYPSEGLR